MRFLAALAGIILFAGAARANDGFFWGAGDTLRPMNNPDLRVLREDLTLAGMAQPACYEVLYKGKAAPPPESYTGEGREFVTIGRRKPCAPADENWPLFQPRWTAEAVYQVEALGDAKDVLFGFPVHVWEAMFQNKNGDNGISAPGVAAFHTYVDGREIAPEGLRWLDGVGASSATKTLGYVWKASFKKGGRYVLRTTYEVGIDMSNGFYAGREFPRDEKPWFAGKPWAVSESGFSFNAHRLIYYLTPLRQWAAPPPAEVLARAELPPGVPMIFAVPIKQKPVCLDERALYFRLADAFPEQELEISYPVPDSAAPFSKVLEDAADAKAWLKTLGPRAALGCALLERLKKESAAPARALLQGRSCRSSCVGAR